MSPAATASPSSLAASSPMRDEILRVGRDLMQTRSFQGFSFQDVADRVGIRKASIYHHFPSKESLGAAVMNDMTVRFLRWSDARRGTPQQQLQAYIDMVRDIVGAGRCLCPAGSSVAGWECMSDELRLAVTTLRDRQVAWLARVIDGIEGLGVPADQMAACFFAVTQGGLLSARMSGRIEDFDFAVAPVRTQLGLKKVG
ncbi:MAG: TetR/AcrR family transcriptional regulator [Rubrivivax sp.]|nr:MAG: TetR/AcrR family transcriptional regulator [Rubrivivax sp.]